MQVCMTMTLSIAKKDLSTVSNSIQFSSVNYCRVTQSTYMYVNTDLYVFLVCNTVRLVSLV